MKPPSGRVICECCDKAGSLTEFAGSLLCPLCRVDAACAEEASDLRERIDKAFPFLTAIRYAAALEGTDAARWAAEAQAALTGEKGSSDTTETFAGAPSGGAHATATGVPERAAESRSGTTP